MPLRTMFGAGYNRPRYITLPVIPTLLMHFNGVNNSQPPTATFKDEIGHSIVGYGGSPTLTADVRYYYNQTSLYLNGSSYIDVNNSSGDLSFGTGDFTISFVVYFPTDFLSPPYSNTPHVLISGSGPSHTNEISIEIQSNGLYVVNHYVGYITGIGNFPIPLEENRFYHFAITRASGVIRIFRDGILEHTANVSNALNFPNNLRIGANHVINSTNIRWASYLYVNELLFIKGHALWVSNFKRPEMPFIF